MNENLTSTKHLSAIASRFSAPILAPTIYRSTSNISPFEILPDLFESKRWKTNFALDIAWTGFTTSLTVVLSGAVPI